MNQDTEKTYDVHKKEKKRQYTPMYIMRLKQGTLTPFPWSSLKLEVRCGTRMREKFYHRLANF